jgi:hypothetical protein
VLRRRLTAPTSTRRRRPIDVEEEGAVDPLEVIPSEDASLALVPSSSNGSVGAGISQAILQTPVVTTVVGWASIPVFIIKILSLMIPCSPFLCSATLLYPLLALACLDIYLYGPMRSKRNDIRSPSIKRMALSLFIHFLILLLASWTDILCPYNASQLSSSGAVFSQL